MNNRHTIVLFTTLLLVASTHASTGDDNHDRRILITRVVGAGAIAAWGLASWDYGERSFHAADEGWFERDSPEGGADKAGHLYTSYVMTRAFTGLYQNWGDDQRSAGREALFTSLLLTGIMELGDGLSPYGVSGEDMIMNVAGSLIGYQLATRENWARRLDLRMEYRPGGRSDPFTDYEHARYLVAVKLDGLNLQERSPLRWLELHAGYYARGYDDPLQRDRRHTYVGLGVNLSRWLDRAGWAGSARLLRYYQIPGTSMRADHELSP